MVYVVLRSVIVFVFCLARAYLFVLYFFIVVLSAFVEFFGFFLWNFVFMLPIRIYSLCLVLMPGFICNASTLIEHFFFLSIFFSVVILRCRPDTARNGLPCSAEHACACGQQARRQVASIKISYL